MVTQASAVHAREKLARLPFMRGRIGGAIAVLLGLLALAMVVMVPLTEDQQALLALGCVAMFLCLNRLKGRTVTILLVLLSSVVSMRYMYWRLTDTLDFTGFWQTFLGTGLLLAEVYALMALVLSYVQSIWPLDRKPVPLPTDPETWPEVDVFIPTYNETLEIVKPTVFAALATLHASDAAQRAAAHPPPACRRRRRRWPSPRRGGAPGCRARSRAARGRRAA